MIVLQLLMRFLNLILKKRTAKAGIKLTILDFYVNINIV